MSTAEKYEHPATDEAWWEYNNRWQRLGYPSKDAFDAAVAESLTTGRYYNGYPSQDDFHKALVTDTRWNEARDAAIEDGTFATGWRHANCSHADGICSG